MISSLVLILVATAAGPRAEAASTAAVAAKDRAEAYYHFSLALQARLVGDAEAALAELAQGGAARSRLRRGPGRDRPPPPRHGQDGRGPGRGAAGRRPRQGQRRGPPDPGAALPAQRRGPHRGGIGSKGGGGVRGGGPPPARRREHPEGPGRPLRAARAAEGIGRRPSSGCWSSTPGTSRRRCSSAPSSSTRRTTSGRRPCSRRPSSCNRTPRGPTARWARSTPGPSSRTRPS